MAMDKEMLLQRLQNQYLTRQEVLFRLPLNISILQFWPELLDRRKMNGVVLPLHRTDGKPYWYVLTDKMVAASERLCEMALNCQEEYDPFKATLTSAMTEEIFFTSFVEGAQIDLQEAMSFLERGTEPENVPEQLIHNNRSAWSDMVKMLYYPIDDRFVRSLAYRLTDEMEGHATDYRQEDTHQIAAMGNEKYEVPPAASIPMLMQEYYAFLAHMDVHPLIKAAVGQAYMLVTRPFPDGNERLGRMISYAIVLPSGYDFFRDISISAAMARENYRYYKSMQEIIREENGGDLTYFMEYYLDLLVRAVDSKTDQDKRRQEELLHAERLAATKPFGMTTIQKEPVAESAFSDEAAFSEPQSEQITFEEHHMPEANEQEVSEIQLYTQDEYIDMLKDTYKHRMGHTQEKRRVRIYNTLVKFAREGPLRFTRIEWETASGTSTGIAKDDMPIMYKMGLIGVEPAKVHTEMRQYFIPIMEQRTAKRDNEGIPEQLQLAIQEMTRSDHSRERQAATGLMDMLEHNLCEFSFAEWKERYPGINKDVAFSLLRIAMNHGLLEYAEGVYRFPSALKTSPKCYHMPDKQRDVLLRLMASFPDEKFTVRNASELIGTKYSTIGYYLDNFLQRGILTMERAQGNVNYYAFSNDVHGIFESGTTDGEETTFTELPSVEKEAHDPLRSAFEAG